MLRPLVRLAAPLALSNLGYQIAGVVDTAMLGRFSDVALAGAGIANGLLFTVTVLGMGIVMGLDTLIPQALGAGDEDRAWTLYRRGLRIAVYAGLPLTALVAVSPALLVAIGVEPDIAREAEIYVLGRLPAVIPFLIVVASRSFLQARSITRPIVWAMIASNALNLVADAALIFGDAALIRIGLPAVGLPALGSLGAALATTLVTMLSAAILLAAVRAQARARGPVREPDTDTARRMTRSIVRLGLPVGAQMAAEVGIFSLMSALAGRLGTTPAAAYSVAVMLASFTFSGVLGISAAASVRVGHAIGARDGTARRVGLLAYAVGAATMIVPALLFVAIPAELAGLFTDDADVIAAAAPMLRVAAVFQVSDSVQAIGAGILRGVGDTRTAMWANLASHYTIGVGVAVALAFYTSVGAPGLWWGLSAGLTVVAAILAWRFFALTRGDIAPVTD